MRSISISELTCIAALSCTAMADDAVRPDPHANHLAVEMGDDAFASWQAGAENPQAGRLSYLQSSRCATLATLATLGTTLDPCSPSRPKLDIAERDYIKSLTLGSYGPMDVKFTGDRVKLKVEF